MTFEIIQKFEKDLKAIDPISTASCCTGLYSPLAQD
jgi:hypothetical protein